MSNKNMRIELTELNENGNLPTNVESFRCVKDPQLDVSNIEISKIFEKEMDLHKQLKEKCKEIEHQKNVITDALHNRKQQLETQENVVKKAIADMVVEISTLDEEIIRVKKLLLTLRLPEGIVKECLNRRASRPDSQSSEDDVKKQLEHLSVQVSDFRHELNGILEQLETQQKENKNSQQRLEYDWSNKKHAIKIDGSNITLNDNPSVAMHKGHVTNMSSKLPSLKIWCSSSREIFEFCENTRKNSINLRSNLDNILRRIAKNLRFNANILEQAFQKHIHAVENIEKCLTGELISVLSNLVRAEQRCESLKISMNNLNQELKISQTRLDNRKSRPDIENVNDCPQESLIKEDKLLHKTQEIMTTTFIETENLINELIKARNILERNINAKRQSIIFDRELLLLLTTNFPCEDELLGITER